MEMIRRWKYRLGFVALAAGLASLATPIAAQTRQPLRDARPAVIADRIVDQIEPTDFFRITRRPVVRIWQDYLLKPGETIRSIVVISGNATIEGEVDRDVVVILGSARLAKSAVIHGSLIVIAGDATIAEGARVRQDLAVVGGLLDAPASFAPNGEHVVVGAPWLGDRVRSIVPWFTNGLLWGRVIVPSIGWVWAVLLLVTLVSLALNALFHEPVGACADTLARKPFSTFLTGLLVLLLAGPVSVLLVASVIGIIVVPFLWCALLVAWVIGKVGVSRWIGRTMTGMQPPESRSQALMTFLLGFGTICVLYAIPVLGIITWAMVGVYGLGAASQTFIAALRRERPPKPAPERPTSPTPAPPTPSGPPPSGPPLEDLPITAFSAVETPSASGHAHAGPAGAGVAAVARPGTDLVLMPRATFLDRLAALALDAALVLIALGLLQARSFHDDEAAGISIALFLAYCTAFWAWKGTSVGGIICNLRLVRADGQPLRFVDALVRGLSSLFSFVALGLGYLWMLRDPESQTWHDKIAGTYVVRVPRDYPLP